MRRRKTAVRIRSEPESFHRKFFPPAASIAKSKLKKSLMFM
jgi:hypothetical protein